ncbi:hypothetical protein VC83_02453 [Pseudogymnoascus destructans]|uniref:Uncharacterized protein n=1 Tax=Pseudogymnoascus destructans TaxID=655981 RepID=A0A177AGJ7_9PEZI|nr:uncharacterized protein VC83_02453 [Pseudogymnoascus destructans]OAF61238.1 hypothetical protein VC83_02453 [Pseudogymnoascus destructans]
MTMGYEPGRRNGKKSQNKMKASYTLYFLIISGNDYLHSITSNRSHPATKTFSQMMNSPSTLMAKRHQCMISKATTIEKTLLLPAAALLEMKSTTLFLSRQ